MRKSCYCDELLRIVDREFFLISAADNVQVSIMEKKYLRCLIICCICITAEKYRNSICRFIIAKKDTCRDDHYNGIRQLFSIVQQEFIRMGNLF